VIVYYKECKNKHNSGILPQRHQITKIMELLHWWVCLICGVLILLRKP